MQRLSSSASNNRLKTCLQFLIIKVNEKSIPKSQQTITTSVNNKIGSPKSHDIKDANNAEQTTNFVVPTKNQNKRIRSDNQQHKQRQQLQKQRHNQLASPPQDQVSSTQDQVGPTQDDHDCQTSPMMLITTQVDDQCVQNDEHLQDSPPTKHENQQTSPMHVRSSPITNYALTTTSTTTTNTSPSQTDLIDGATISCNSTRRINTDSQSRQASSSKRRKLHNSSDHDTSSAASWTSSSYASPPSPLSTSSTSSISSSSSRSSSSSCSSSISPSPSPSPLSSPDIVNELKRPRLKLTEEKIRKIKRRSAIFDDYYTEHSFASTPTTSSGCSPGQHSNTTQNSDQSRSGLSTSNMVIHMFQAPPKFVNNLKPCNLPTKPQKPSPPTTPPVPTKEMLNCAICGIKDRPPNISKIYGQNSCLLCTRFFATFLKRPQQLYCAQDGDCLMTFDSRCQACWIKICLQKFDIEEEHRKVGQKFSPKLLSSPNVSLITIDTSLSR